MDIITKNEVRGYVDETGIVMLNLEDIAFGLELTEHHDHSKVKWIYVNECLRDLKYGKRVKKNGFIPEIFFHRLAISTGRFKTCEHFYLKVANEIVPYIREQSQILAFNEKFDEFADISSEHDKQLRDLCENQTRFNFDVSRQDENIFELESSINQIKESVAVLKELINPENIIEPIRENFLHTNNIVGNISKQFDIKPRTIWNKFEEDMNKQFGLTFQTEMVKAKKQLEAFYYRKCQEYGGSRKVPKNIKRPSQIKAMTLNQLWSSNSEWYQAVVNILESMKNAVKAA